MCSGAILLPVCFQSLCWTEIKPWSHCMPFKVVRSLQNNLQVWSGRATTFCLKNTPERWHGKDAIWFFFFHKRMSTETKRLFEDVLLGKIQGRERKENGLLCLSLLTPLSQLMCDFTGPDTTRYLARLIFFRTRARHRQALGSRLWAVKTQRWRALQGQTLKWY